MKRLLFAMVTCALVVHAQDAPDNALTADEKEAGWVLLFNGKDLTGWMAEDETPSTAKVEDGAINPSTASSPLVVYKEYYGDYILSLDFKIGAGCDAGVLVRLFPLTSVRDNPVSWNGLEVAIADSTGTDYTDTGAIHDLVAPTANAMKPVGEWNRMVVTCNRNLITVELNGQTVSNMNLDDFKEPNRRPDGSEHGYDKSWYTHSRQGYIALQNGGSPCWFKNIKLMPLNADARGRRESDRIIK
ncbi:MAG: DUF1080 domain-containing protein [Candidatus Hydrogenedentes bacterium]|nr:DUF1080 domain-containing protein [Candidatus Hydrogenedentota bacterium]